MTSRALLKVDNKSNLQSKTPPTVTCTHDNIIYTFQVDRKQLENSEILLLNPENGENVFLWNITTYLPDYTILS
jgi:hypothetical protein